MAYAVPIGIVCIALINSTMLTHKETRKPAYHKYIAIPTVSLALPMQKTKAISNKPAMIKTIQLIISLEKGQHRILQLSLRQTSQTLFD